jgi:hypothetical protein
MDVEEDAYLKLPRVSEVEYLWADAWYDGPLSGMCKYQDEMLWFHAQNVVEDADGHSRWHYTLHRLPPEQLEDAVKWHDLFCEKVGTHFDKCEGGG